MERSYVLFSYAKLLNLLDSANEVIKRLRIEFNVYFNISNVTSTLKEATLKSHPFFLLVTMVCC